MQHPIPLTMRELSRYAILQQLLAKKINGTEAARQLRLTTRQVRRLKRKVERHGPKGLAHASRGKRSNRRIREKTVESVLKILKARYADFKPTFACEKLAERHEIRLSAESIRQIMIQGGLWRAKSRRMKSAYHAWRERKASYGELEQFDGSYEAWFEDRAERCCLLATIDDATGRITQARFVGNEGVKAVCGFWKQYVESHGKPLGVYLDRHSTYKINAKTLADDPQALTQFERSMRQLDIDVIHAFSPQAKGRIERLFGTLQDRLVKELRLAGVSAIPEANRFLREVFIPRFNAQFGTTARTRGDLHRKLVLPERKQLETIFAIHERRTVQSDFTILYEGLWLQLAPSQPVLVRHKEVIEVEERLDGSLYLGLRGKYLNFERLIRKPEKVRMKVLALAHDRASAPPSTNHPWRRSFSTQKSFAGDLSPE